MYIQMLAFLDQCFAFEANCCMFWTLFCREFSKYPPEQTNRKKFVRRKKEDVIRKPTPESVKKIPRDQIYGILHPNR
jgi:hypothetical protein